MLVGPMNSHNSKLISDWGAKPYCNCWNKRSSMPWTGLSVCSCGEDNNVSEWKWEYPDPEALRCVVFSDDQKQVTFHPSYSSGTAVVKGDTPLLRDYHYYWEVKMLSDAYGTDIMVGLGTNKVNTKDNQFNFTSLLGGDAESYGLSYRGDLRHNSNVTRDTTGFCRGTIIGVRVDMWQGTLEFYLNRKPQGICFYNLRRHEELYPMLCSTAAKSCLRLIYAASWRASLLVDAARSLAAAASKGAPMPPGLWRRMREQFWLTLPTDGSLMDSDDDDGAMHAEAIKSTNIFAEFLPVPYVQGVLLNTEDTIFNYHQIP